MPEAWWTTYRNRTPASSSAASSPGGVRLQRRTAWVGDVGRDERIGVLFVVSGPGRSQYR